MGVAFTVPLTSLMSRDGHVLVYTHGYISAQNPWNIVHARPQSLPNQTALHTCSRSTVNRTSTKTPNLLYVGKSVRDAIARHCKALQCIELHFTARDAGSPPFLKGPMSVTQSGCSGSESVDIVDGWFILQPDLSMSWEGRAEACVHRRARLGSERLNVWSR